MAAHIKKALYPATAIATDTTTTGVKFQLHPHAKELVAVSTVSSRTDGTYTTSIEHSPDGSTWFTLATGAAQSADGSVAVTVASTVSVFQWVRASILSASTTTGATVTVDLYHGTQR